MYRYQIVYNKANSMACPLTTWETDRQAATRKAEAYRRAGYHVTVWQHGKNGSARTDI